MHLLEHLTHARASCFHWDSPRAASVVARWQAELDRISPPTEHLSTLKIVWEPGDLWQPKQRYVVWVLAPSIVPAQVKSLRRIFTNERFNIHPDIHRGLTGPHPRSTGHYCGKDYCICGDQDVHPGGTWKWRWVGGPSTVVPGIDRMTWELYQQTGRYGRRWWVIQGEDGGHRVDYTQAERHHAEVRGLPSRPPLMAALPYAEPDNRFFSQIARQDKLRAWRKMRDFVTRDADDVQADERAEREAVASALEAKIEHEVDEWYSNYGKYYRKQMSDLTFNPSRTLRPVDGDQITERFRQRIAE